MIIKLLKGWKENLSLKLIALVIAVFIWLFVSNQNDPTRTVTIQNVPITIVNEDSIGDIGKVAEPTGSDTVTVKVTERKSVVNRLGRNNFYVEADLENINQMNTVPLTVSCENARVSWDEIQITPAALKVNVEDKIEQTFSISVTTTGETASGYAVGRTEIPDGKTILIAGPESLINIINQVVAPVSVAGLNEDKDLTASLRVYDKNGSELTETQLSRLEFKSSSGAVLEDRTLTIRVSLWEERADFPLMVGTTGTPGAGYEVSDVTLLPAAATLIGTPEAFEEVGSILLIKDSVDVSGITENMTAEIDLTSTVEEYTDLRLPADADPLISVQVSVEKTGYLTIDIPMSDITLLNKPDNMKLVFTPADKISFGIRSEDGNMREPNRAGIKASMDLGVCEKEGNYDIPVSITLPEGYTLGGEVIVKVNASDQDTEAQQTLEISSGGEEAQSEADEAGEEEDDEAQGWLNIG